MSLFERLSTPSLKSQARETGVPAPILKKVYDRGVKDATKAESPADPADWGQARVAAFVRGGTDREKDGDLWKKYHAEQAPPVVAARPTTGVFIPLPSAMAQYYPKKAEDTSPPHLTLLFIGEITPAEEKKLVEVVREVADHWPPFRADVVGYDEFQNKEGQTIAHMIPTASICLSAEDEVYRGLADLHADLFAAIEDAGIDVQHNYGGEKSGGHSERVGAFKSHATLAYVPAGESYSGPKPTGSWHVTEIEVWGHEKYRVPLGMKPNWVAVPQSIEPEPEEEDGPSVEIQVRALPEAVVESVAEAPAKEPIKLKTIEAIKTDTQSATGNAAKETLLRQALSSGTTRPLPKIELPAAPVRFVPPAPAKPLAPAQVKSEALVESTVKSTIEPPVEKLVETPVKMETAVVAELLETASHLPQPQLPTVVPAPAPVPAPEPEPEPAKIKPVQFFERFGHLTDSVLEIGGTEEHDYARLDPLVEDDHTSRLWKTIVCGSLYEQSPSERVATLLAARGLLAPEGRVLVALPESVSDTQAADFQSLFSRFFNPTMLSAKGLIAWSLTSNKPVVEQTQPGFDQSKMPPINLGPVYIRVPEREVHVQVQAPINQKFDMPAAEAPQFVVGPGAFQIDVHTPAPPPPVKKRVTMTKDANGKTTGVLEVVEDKESQRPEFPSVEEILADTSRDDLKQE